MGYLANFMVYTLAMVGIIVVALLVFKNATSGNCGGRTSKHLKVLDTMSLGPRKTLYIVSAGNEKFLIAGDVDKTTLISKLETTTTTEFSTKEEEHITKESQTFQSTMSNLAKSTFMDKSNIGINSSIISQNKNKSVMRNLAEVLRK